MPDLLAGVAMAFVEHAAIKAVVAATRQGRRSLGLLSVDGLILAASLVLLREARNGRDAPARARFMLWLGILARRSARTSPTAPVRPAERADLGLARSGAFIGCLTGPLRS